MEKFGIFNLLSALSSLAAKPAEAEPAKREEPPAPPPDAETAPAAGVFTAEERKTRAAATPRGMKNRRTARFRAEVGGFFRSSAIAGENYLFEN